VVVVVLLLLRGGAGVAWRWVLLLAGGAVQGRVLERVAAVADRVAAARVAEGGPSGLQQAAQRQLWD
jgi:hypothetical protein